MRRLTVMLAASLMLMGAARAYDWSSGPWGIFAAANGSPGSASVPIAYPGGSKTGNALAVHYVVRTNHEPQLWVLLTDGFWRQTSPHAEFLTSYRLLSYYSQNDEVRDKCTASRFDVLGVNTAGQLVIQCVYSNNAPLATNLFRIEATVTLEPPGELETAMSAALTISNATGRAVVPFWAGHNALAEQWVLFGISSMFVADDFSAGLPPWYNGLDPGHIYVGITNDASPLNDGRSVKGDIHVSTHDTKFIQAGDTSVALVRDNVLCPWVTIPDYTWYTQLVMHGVASDRVETRHLHHSARNHRVDILSASGLVASASNLRWAATYNRDDTNMVDGDNIQVKLGIDAAIADWPAHAVQHLHLRMTTGNQRHQTRTWREQDNRGVMTWDTEPGESYRMEKANSIAGSWTSIQSGVTSPATVDVAAATGFFRVVENGEP